MNRSAHDHCHVLVVGAGPAGSTCARRLREHGLDVRMIDKAKFPRDKVCAGWVTPQVMSLLHINRHSYANGRTLQPITGFRVGMFDGPIVQVDYDHPVSYGIRRCEFDDYLVGESGVPIQSGYPLDSLERTETGWLVNQTLHADIVIGAGGHFCPVARAICGRENEHSDQAVAAQETEFRMSSHELAGCRIAPEVPELYFYPDLRGYAWCFRKQNYLNIGLGRLGERNLSHCRRDLLRYLVGSGRIAAAPAAAFRGHAYRLAQNRRQPAFADHVLLIGDSAGLAGSHSGEGMRPAIESGIIAADIVIRAGSDHSASALSHYAEILDERFGTSGSVDRTDRLFSIVRRSVARRLLRTEWFVRSVVLDRWFLNRKLPPWTSAA